MDEEPDKVQLEMAGTDKCDEEYLIASVRNRPHDEKTNDDEHILKLRDLLRY